MEYEKNMSLTDVDVREILPAAYTGDITLQRIWYRLTEVCTSMALARTGAPYSLSREDIVQEVAHRLLRNQFDPARGMSAQELDNDNARMHAARRLASYVRLTVQSIVVDAAAYDNRMEFRDPRHFGDNANPDGDGQTCPDTLIFAGGDITHSLRGLPAIEKHLTEQDLHLITAYDADENQATLAQKLGMGVSTVKRHVGRVRRKIEAAYFEPVGLQRLASFASASRPVGKLYRRASIGQLQTIRMLRFWYSKSDWIDASMPVDDGGLLPLNELVSLADSLALKRQRPEFIVSVGKRQCIRRQDLGLLQEFVDMRTARRPREVSPREGYVTISAASHTHGEYNYLRSKLIRHAFSSSFRVDGRGTAYVPEAEAAALLEAYRAQKSALPN